MQILVDFSLNTLGKFAKNELYFAWKLLKYGSNLKFFSNPISQLTQKSIGKIKGMSWDLFAFRYQETLSTKDDLGEFYVPFLHLLIINLLIWHMRVQYVVSLLIAKIKES